MIVAIIPNHIFMNINTFIEQIHHGQKRKTGEPYTDHLHSVKSILEQQGISDETILHAALLHDSLEDGNVTKNFLAASFGKKVAEIVDVLSKKDFWHTSYCKMKSNLDEMENTREEYPEAVLIKMADRIHNLQTLHGFSPKKQQEYLEETQELLIPAFENVLRKNQESRWQKPMQNLLQQILNILESSNHKILGAIPETQKPLGIIKYEGWEGVRKVYLEVLQEAIKTGEPILAFENIPDKEVSPIGKRFLENYLQKRFEHKIIAKVIAPNTAASREYAANEHPFTEAKIVKNLLMKGTINIVGSLVMSYSTDPVQGTLRRDSIEAHDLKHLFQYLWNVSRDSVSTT
jgi:hypothetical protein